MVGLQPTNAPPLDDWQTFLEELCVVCHGHREITSLTEKDIGSLQREGKKIRAAGFGVADLRAWMVNHWFQDWRWKKDQQRPKPHEVRSSIPVVRAEPSSAKGSYDPDDFHEPKPTKRYSLEPTP
jgi:hypothetical protein